MWFLKIIGSFLQKRTKNSDIDENVIQFAGITYLMAITQAGPPEQWQGMPAKFNTPFSPPIWFDALLVIQ